MSGDKLPIVERLEKHVFYGDARMFNFKQHSPLAMEAASTITELVSALEPLAALRVPFKPQGNAGAYSIRHSDIERARTALSNTRGDTK